MISPATVREQYGALAVRDDVAGFFGRERGVGQLTARGVENTKPLIGRDQHVLGVACRIHPQEAVQRKVGS